MLLTIQYHWDDLFKIYGGESLLCVQHDLLLHRFEVARIHFLLWLQRKNNIQSLYFSPTHVQSISSVQNFAVKAVEFSSPSLHQIFFVLRVKRSWQHILFLFIQKKNVPPVTAILAAPCLITLFYDCILQLLLKKRRAKGRRQ